MLSALLAISPARAQTTPAVTVRVAPAAVEVPAGQPTDVAVEVVDVQDLYGFDLALTFDPNAVEIMDADPSQTGVQMALGTFLDPGFVVLNSADNARGTLRFAMTQLNPSSPKSGTGTLIVIRLRGKQVSSSTPLTLTNAQLAMRDGGSLLTHLISGQVSVVAMGSAPTSTPIPTQGSGTPMMTFTPPSLPAMAATATSPAATSPAATSPAATVTPVTHSTTAPLTSTPPITAQAATITPRPTNQPATTTPGALSQSPPASAAINPLPGGIRAAETPQLTPQLSAPLAVEAIRTQAAVAAVATPAATSAGIRAAIQVTEQPAAPTAHTQGSATVLLALSGVLGIVGIVILLLVVRRHSH